MSNIFDSITDSQRRLIESAPMFFVASAVVDGRDAAGPGPVNLSPKGGTPLHVLAPDRVAYVDFPGSGNETARHAGLDAPITIMVCSFNADDAAIVRLYGRARIAAADDPEFAGLVPVDRKSRQVIEVRVDRTMTSCGYGVPVMEFVRMRERGDRGRAFKE